MEYLTLLGIIALAAFVSTIIGALWYSLLFRKIWMNLVWPNIDQSARPPKKEMIQKTLVSFFGDILVAAALIFVPLVTGANPFILSIIYWIGFMIPVMKDGSLYEGRSWKVFAIGAGYRLVSLLAMATVFYFV